MAGHFLLVILEPRRDTRGRQTAAEAAVVLQTQETSPRVDREARAESSEAEAEQY